MRLPVILAAGAIVLVAAAGAWYVLTPAPVSPAPAAAAGPVAPVARPVEPAPAPVAPDPAPTSARRTTPKPAAPAAVAAAPVEVAPTTGTLRIETDVPDASVFLDRVGVGTAPMTIPNVSPGSHRLNVAATGYDGYAETIEVEPGPRTIAIAFKEVKLDAKLDAVHKHGMGSCRGVLRATPQGLRYEAGDGKDSFSVTLADVVALDVDYLAKNLRLRTKQGRTYNFGDPAGSADNLFVFQQDVEKARKRLASGN